MIRQEEVYRIGQIGKPHGVRGEQLFMFSDDIFDRVDAEYLVICKDGILIPFFIEEYRFRSNETAIIKFCDIDSQEQARELTNCEVFFPRALSDGDNETVYWPEIVGYTMADAATGEKIGQIISVDDATANILFELDNKLLIPANEELITDVDTQRRVITVKIPDGLLDL